MIHFSEGRRKERHLVLQRHPPLLVPGHFNHEQCEWIPCTCLVFLIPGELFISTDHHHTPKTEASSNIPSSLSLLTFNVLYSNEDDTDDNSGLPKDYNVSDIANGAVRLPHQLNFLKSLQSDLLVLQESHPSFKSSLLAQKWVQEKYFISNVDDTITDDLYGGLILSRFPIVRSYLLLHSNSPKRTTIIELAVGSVRIGVVCVHLKAGNCEQFSWVRASELHNITDCLRHLGTNLNFVAGSFTSVSLTFILR